MSTALKITETSQSNPVFAKPDKFIVFLCVSKTQLKQFSFLEGAQRAIKEAKAEGFSPVHEYISGTKAFKISYDFPFFVKTSLISDEEGSSQLIHTDHLKVGCRLSEITFFHFPSDCALLAYTYSLTTMKVLSDGEASSLYSEIEGELFRLSERIFKDTQASDLWVGAEAVLNWRYGYALYFGEPKADHFPFVRCEEDVQKFMNIETGIKKEFIRQNVFHWEYAYVNWPNEDRVKEADLLSLVAYQCFLYYQLDQMQKDMVSLILELQESFLHRKKKDMDRLIDRSVLFRLEANKLADAFLVDRITYARDYQAILRQLEISFESDRKLRLLQASTKEMVNLVKHVNDIIEVRTSGMIQKVLVALAFYALPGAIVDSATFIGVLPESYAPEVRVLLFVFLIFTLVGIPYVSIHLRQRLFGD